MRTVDGIDVAVDVGVVAEHVDLHVRVHENRQRVVVVRDRRVRGLRRRRGRRRWPRGGRRGAAAGPGVARRRRRSRRRGPGVAAAPAAAGRCRRRDGDAARKCRRGDARGSGRRRRGDGGGRRRGRCLARFGGGLAAEIGTARRRCGVVVVVVGPAPAPACAEAANAASSGAATCAGVTTMGTRLTAARLAAVTAVRAGTSAPVTPRRTSSGTVASHAIGPSTRRRSPSEIARNARTISGSNCVPGVVGQFDARLGRRERLLVGTGRGHHVERVGDGDDAAGERDLLAGEAVRVARAVEPFVVLARGATPVAEPRAQADQPLVAGAGMPSDLLPLLGRQLALLVEDLRGNFELADVVQQRGPVQTRRALRIEAELLADEVGVGRAPVRSGLGSVGRAG